MKKINGHTFEFESKGTLCFDPGQGTKHHEPYWCIVKIDPEIASYYRWHLLMHGQDTFQPNTLWGFHISAIKGEAPTKNIDKWSDLDGKIVSFYYGNYVSYSNGRHAWINCYSDDLADLREYYGLDVCNRKLKFHATLGRLKKPWQPDVKRPGTIYDDGDGLFSI
jgi:hypothetical protein